MNKIAVKVIVALMVALSLSACDGYSKLLKGNDYELKYTKAFEYYDAQKYDKALQLFEQIMPIYKGLEKGEKVMFYYSMTTYKVKDYYSAGYYFRKFSQTYPYSEYNEQSMYLGAYCYYLDSPKPSLDQESTNLAINEFEMFLSKYPETSKKDSCNMLLDELRHKLQVKSYNNAYLYYKLSLYKAARIALGNAMEEYPDSPFREDILYYKAKASYTYADLSVEAKRLERMQDARAEINTYLKAYPEGQYAKEMTKLRRNAEQVLNL